MNRRKVFSSVASLLLVLTVYTPVGSFAMEDMPDDWSTDALESAVSNGLLKGYNDKILPNEDITRAEAVTVINRMFGTFKGESIQKYTDVSTDNWYFNEMEKGTYMETITGWDNKLYPDDAITREEAFVVIGRALNLSDDIQMNKVFSDSDEISIWARGKINSLVNNGYIQGGADNKLYPKENITRAEFAKLIYNIVPEYVPAGTKTISLKPTGNLMINTPGVTLKDTTVPGDLIIGDGVGEGDVFLDNVQIKGRLLVRGGGSHSVHFTNHTNINQVNIHKKGEIVRILSDSTSDVGDTRITGYSDVILRGYDQKGIEVNSPNVTVTIKGSDIEQVGVNKENVTIIADTGSSVGRLSIKGRSTTVRISGYVKEIKGDTDSGEAKIIVDSSGIVENIESKGAGTEISGKGKVSSVDANANDIHISTKGTEVKAGKHIKGVEASGKSVAAGKTVNKTVTKSSSSRHKSKSSGSSSSSNPVTPPKPSATLKVSLNSKITGLGMPTSTITVSTNTVGTPKVYSFYFDEELIESTTSGEVIVPTVMLKDLSRIKIKIGTEKEEVTTLNILPLF